MNGRRGNKVRIVNAEGAYLTVRSDQWGFTPDRARAAIFDYVGDRVAQQIEIIQKRVGLTLKPAPLDPAELYETCDRCERMVMPFLLFFDGKEFLCEDCRGRAGIVPRRS